MQRFAVSGEVSQILNQAERARVEAEQSARRILALYQGEAAAEYRQNPSLVIQSDWSRVLRSILARETVEVLKLPAGPIHLMVNLDPEIRRRILELEQERLNEEAQERRERRRREERFRTDTEMRQFTG
ncbi:MAG: hypothetical protein KatS3mg103_0545 [Phycisphaerales bacterium]|nr:MAG: hypothetical protein KatS3mg103_0545 [Phycisphaerales bacterium]